MAPLPRGTAPAPVRVAQVCGATDGAQWMVDLCASLQHRGYSVLAVIQSAEGGTAAALDAVGVRYVTSPQNLGPTRQGLGRIAARVPVIGTKLARSLRLVAVAGHVLRLAVLLRRERIDISHAQVYSSIIIGRIAAWIARVPVRLSMVPGPYHLEVPVFRRSDLVTQWMDHRLVGGSQRVDDLYAEAGISSARRAVIRYGADPSDFDPDRADPLRVRRELGLSEATPVVGQVAYFYPPSPAWFTPPGVGGRGVKGHEDFVDAASLVLEDRPDVRFLLVGAGFGPTGEEYRHTVEERCRRLGIDHAVIFTGHRQDVADVLAALDVSVQCSLNENYGGTIESLLMRRPTIATRVGGMPEAVRDEETGLLVPPLNPPALAAAMIRLLDDRELGARLGERGRRLMIEGWTTQGMCDGVDRLYRELLRERLPRKAPPVAV